MQIEEAIEILRKDILIDDCFINHELDVIFKESTKIAIETVLNELDIYKTNNEILHGELDRIGIDTLKLEKGMSTDDVIEEIKKKDKVINEIEDLCIRKSDEEGREYGGVIIWNFANKIMDIIKKAQK